MWVCYELKSVVIQSFIRTYGPCEPLRPVISFHFFLSETSWTTSDSVQPHQFEIAEFAGLEIAWLEFDGQHRRVENAGLENDVVENDRLQVLNYMELDCDAYIKKWL